MLLQHFHLLQRSSSSCMLEWMPWTLRSGNLRATGNEYKLSQLLSSTAHGIWLLLLYNDPWKVAGKIVTHVLFSPWTLVGASVTLLCLVLLGRAAFVFPLSFIANLTRKSKCEKIAFKQQVFTFGFYSLFCHLDLQFCVTYANLNRLWYGGLASCAVLYLWHLHIGRYKNELYMLPNCIELQC